MLEPVPKRRDVSTGSSAGSTQLWDLCPIPGMSFPPGLCHTGVTSLSWHQLSPELEPSRGLGWGEGDLGMGRRRFGDGEGFSWVRG